MGVMGQAGPVLDGEAVWTAAVAAARVRRRVPPLTAGDGRSTAEAGCLGAGWVPAGQWGTATG